jgi:hypothetical protein
VAEQVSNGQVNLNGSTRRAASPESLDPQDAGRLDE